MEAAAAEESRAAISILTCGPVSLCTTKNLVLWASHLYYHLSNWQNMLFAAWVMDLYLVKQWAIFH